ncbi:MAG: hypothetical protein AB1758_03010 [Candidatus Eremiobacterota bacterium]
MNGNTLFDPTTSITIEYTVPDSFHYFLRQGDHYRVEGELPLALQCYATAGSLAQSLGEPGLEGEALARELEAHLDADDPDSAAQVYQELSHLCPRQATELLERLSQRQEPHLEHLLARMADPRGLLWSAYEALLREGPSSAAHRAFLQQFLAAVGNDFSGYPREQLTPVLLSAYYNGLWDGDFLRLRGQVPVGHAHQVVGVPQQLLVGHPPRPTETIL